MMEEAVSISRKRTIEQMYEDDEQQEEDDGYDNNITTPQLKKIKFGLYPKCYYITNLFPLSEYMNDNKKRAEFNQSLNFAIVNYRKYFQTNGFRENLERAKLFLLSHNLDLTEENEGNCHDDDILQTNNILDKSIQITNILNRRTRNPFRLSSLNGKSDVEIVPFDLHFLQTMYEVCYCTIYLFSTRAQPKIITPFMESNSLLGGPTKPKFAVLRHVESYLPQRSRWYPLRLLDCPVSLDVIRIPKKLLYNPLESSAINNNGDGVFSAKPIPANYKKPTAPAMPTKDKISDEENIESYNQQSQSNIFGKMEFGIGCWRSEKEAKRTHCGCLYPGFKE